MNDHSNNELLSHTATLALVAQAHAGDMDARDQLVFANTGLVRSIAIRYIGRGLDMDDLIQEGTIGLLTAIDRYKSTKGAVLTTYATPWIHQACQRAVDHDGATIRKPVHLREKERRLEKAQAAHIALYGTPPTDAELAQACGTSTHDVANVRRAQGMQPCSLDKPLAVVMGAETWTLADVLPDTRATDVAEQAVQQEQAQRIAQALDKLSDHERQVIMLRYFDGQRTMADVGAQLGISRQRVEQIEARAVYKLRALLADEVANEQRTHNTRRCLRHGCFILARVGGMCKAHYDAAARERKQREAGQIALLGDGGNA